jgi:hypothetical protein
MGAGLLMEHLDRSGRSAHLWQRPEMALGLLGLPRVLDAKRHRVDSRTKRNNCGICFRSGLWTTRSRFIGGGSCWPDSIWALGNDERCTNRAGTIEEWTCLKSDRSDLHALAGDNCRLARANSIHLLAESVGPQGSSLATHGSGPRRRH